MQFDQDVIFSAMADKNRRKVIELLHKENSTLLELADSFDISFQALSKHVKILERAQLLNKEKQGKYRVLSLNQEALKQALQWITYYSDFWNQSFDKLNSLIEKERRPGEFK